MNLLLKNGMVYDYANDIHEVTDILLENDLIKEIGTISGSYDEVIDCTGLVIIPGMIDMHCHLREPGGEHKETIETGSRSAVKGGFTTICFEKNNR